MKFQRLDAARVRNAVDIVALIGHDVPLSPSGSTAFTGICPWHAEQSPSLSVDGVKQVYYCFGCGASGDSITYVMQTRRLSFGKALSYLWRHQNRYKGSSRLRYVSRFGHGTYAVTVMNRVLLRVTKLVQCWWRWPMHLQGFSVDSFFVQRMGPRQIAEATAQDWAESLTMRVVEGELDYPEYLLEEQELSKFLAAHDLAV